MIMTVMLSGWSLPRLLLAFLQHQAEFCLCFHNHLSKNPVVPFESTIPTYIWYLRAIPNEDFHVPSQNLIQKFPFCNRTSSWCGEEKSLSFMQKDLTKVLTSEMQKEKSCTSPILDDGMN